MTAKVEIAAEIACTLGEGPVWDERAGVLYFTDILAPAFWRFDPRNGEAESLDMPFPVGCFALAGENRFIAGTLRGIDLIDLDEDSVEPLDPFITHDARLRCNDGKCDPRGRFWTGTMDMDETDPHGHLFRFADHRLKRHALGWTITNGLDWSGDGRTMYASNSTAREIWAFAYDLDAGTIGEGRVFAQLSEDEGFPDGCCIDAEDHLWGARWDGSCIVRYRPDGSIERRIDLPVPRVTSCCFGGPGLDELYVTTARIGLDSAQLDAAPHSGALFRITGLGVKGRPAHRYAGAL